MKVEIMVGEGGILPVYATEKSAALDIATPENFQINPGDVHYVNTRLIVGAPDGYCFKLYARSGLATKRGIVLANGVGIIDADYCGPDDYLTVALENVSSEVAYFQRGDRVAQMILEECPRIHWVLTNELNEENRGGFGSTGVTVVS